MQSVITKIRAGKQYRQARILFDTGSQRTFVTQDMKHKFELKAMGKELLDVTTLGSFQSIRNQNKSASNSNYLSTAISPDEESKDAS